VYSVRAGKNTRGVEFVPHDVAPRRLSGDGVGCGGGGGAGRLTAQSQPTGALHDRDGACSPTAGKYRRRGAPAAAELPSAGKRLGELLACPRPSRRSARAGRRRRGGRWRRRRLRPLRGTCFVEWPCMGSRMHSDPMSRWPEPPWSSLTWQVTLPTVMSFGSDSSLELGGSVDLDDEGLMGGLPSIDSLGGLPFQASGSPSGDALRLSFQSTPSMGDTTDMAM
jgi:hypothetical protein